MIPIVWITTSAQAVSRTVRVVRCESCCAEYAFKWTVRGHGKVVKPYGLGSDAKTHARAERDLERRLREHVEPVPCPACGWYQADMLPVLRRRRPRVIDDTAFVFLLVTSMTAAIACLGLDDPMVFGPGQAVLKSVALYFLIGFSILCAGLTIGRAVLIRRHNRTYDPNTEMVQSERVDLGRKRAVLRTDYEKEYGPLRQLTDPGRDSA